MNKNTLNVEWVPPDQLHLNPSNPRLNESAVPWRGTVRVAQALGVPVLAHAASLSYFDAYRRERMPANLTQGQRDYFGAHTYERVDREGIFHTEWMQEGG